MEQTPLLLRATKGYAVKLSQRSHGIIALLSFITYVSMIIFAFVPLTREIRVVSGYSTSDLQQATTRSEADLILSNFDPVINLVKLLTIADYIFIIAGFFLFFSLQSIFYRYLSTSSKFHYFPLIGMILTIISRTLDSLENLWVLFMYSNPETYPTFLIPLTNYTESAKWFVVNIEYSVLAINLLLTILVILKNKSSDQIDQE